VEALSQEFVASERLLEHRRALVRQLSDNLRNLTNAIQTFTAEKSRQTSANQGLKEETLKVLNATQDLKAANAILKRESVGHELEYRALSKQREEQLAEYDTCYGGLMGFVFLSLGSFGLCFFFWFVFCSPQIIVY
jgi:hypothetical protein